MCFDFASRRATGGLSTLELKGTDQLKKGSSWPLSSGAETMSTMPGETRVVINWSSHFIDKTRVCPARHRSFGARESLSSSSSSSNPATRSDKVLECGSIAPSPNCTRAAVWKCSSITALRLCYSAPKPCVGSRLNIKTHLQAQAKWPNCRKNISFDTAAAMVGSFPLHESRLRL
jgi:hypothetical protein